jgi:hypothetical protein
MKDWKLIIIGDLKTPHELYKDYNYLTPEAQSVKYPDLSRLLGWNCIQRRNIGFVEALRWGAEIIATVDDDNIPYDRWGENVLEEVNADYYETELEAFDPLFSYPFWHRGYPLELISRKKEVRYMGRRKIKPLVQADLWDGDPDIDAIARISFSPIIKFNIDKPFFANKISPFNSQNTFFSKECFPTYFLFPFIGRMDDIWASYYLQSKYPQSVIYNKASVYQERNKHNLIKDLENEMKGYDLNLEIVKNPELLLSFLPKQSIEAYKEYQRLLT